MVKMFVYKYVGPELSIFTKDKLYIGRINKAGAKMAKDDNGCWRIVEDGRMTISRMKHYFEVIEEFCVKNHKIALNYTL